jgi:hypothetical protein
MPPTELVAIISEAPALTLAELEPVAAALQKQVDRDFGPVWNVAARVIAVAPGEAPPDGAWAVTVKHHVAGEESGFHHDNDGLPFATIEYEAGWSLGASHELLEMLVDPLGERLLPGRAPTDSAEVHFLVEVCDPCQESTHAYAIDGVSVSDFLTPAYYDAGSPPDAACSFTGSVKTPFEVLEGGYITWQVPGTGYLWQGHWPLGGGAPDLRRLGPLPDLSAQNKSLRVWVDAETLRQGMPGSPHAPADPAAATQASGSPSVPATKPQSASASQAPIHRRNGHGASTSTGMGSDPST